MTFTLPLALQNPDDTAARSLLEDYYGPARVRGGATFDGWDSLGSRARDTNRFTADDIVAVSFLSVQVPPSAARQLLLDSAADFANMLEEVGTDRDLVGEDQPIVRTWPAWILYDEVDALFKIGPTIATKILARKRPRLLPIIDDVVRTVVDSAAVWEPLRLVLREDGGALHERLLRLHRDVQLPPQVSPLRVFDVIAWGEGKGLGYGARLR